MTREEELQSLVARLRIRIDNRDLLDRALTHASIATETRDVTGDYESLEFLGDAVLGLVIAHELFERMPDRTPGEYSRLRAGLVNRRCVARVAKALDVAPFIRLGRGEEMSGGRHRQALLADCMEALIGTIYLDQGWESAKAFVARVFHDEVEQACHAPVIWDYKSRLQNHCQAERISLPKFEVVRSEGPDHEKEFEIEVVVRGKPCGRGTGRSKKEAEQLAAKAALETEGVRLEEG